MRLRFRRTIELGPGLRLKLGKKSASLTVGGVLGRTTFSTTGRVTDGTSMPGTGIYLQRQRRIAQGRSGGCSRNRRGVRRSRACLPRRA